MPLICLWVGMFLNRVLDLPELELQARKCVLGTYLWKVIKGPSVLSNLCSGRNYFLQSQSMLL